jgi:excisionase family DNA binding protein
MTNNSKSVAGTGLIAKIESSGTALTVRALADVLGVSGKTVYRAIRSGGLRAIRTASIYRIDPIDAANWLKAHLTVQGAA